MATQSNELSIALPNKTIQVLSCFVFAISNYIVVSALLCLWLCLTIWIWVYVNGPPGHSVLELAPSNL